MSIYCSRLSLSHDSHDETPARQRPAIYRGSHLYPLLADGRAYIDTASIPHWCIPGHDGEGPGAECTAPGCDAEPDGDASGIAPYLRLDVGDESGHHTIVIPVDAARELRDELIDWIARVWTSEEVDDDAD